MTLENLHKNLGELASRSLEKIKLAKTSTAANDPALQAFLSSVESALSAMLDRANWRPGINMPDSTWAQLEAMENGIATGADPATLKSGLADLVVNLEMHLLLPARPTVLDPAFNLQVLDRLRLIGQQLEERKAFFKKLGLSLDEEPYFIVLKEEQEPVRNRYRSALRFNEVQSTAADLRVFESTQKTLALVPDFTALFRVFKAHTENMRKRLPEGSAQGKQNAPV